MGGMAGRGGIGGKAIGNCYRTRVSRVSRVCPGDIRNPVMPYDCPLITL